MSPAPCPQPDPDPLDGNGHGSHVAGTAAGIGVPGSVGPGVAPGAELYALKVFGDAGGTTDVTSLAIEWAMDPNGDGDMSDHLDVINMSLGSPFGEPDDPSAISTQQRGRARHHRRDLGRQRRRRAVRHRRAGRRQLCDLDRGEHAGRPSLRALHRECAGVVAGTFTRRWKAQVR